MPWSKRWSRRRWVPPAVLAGVLLAWGASWLARRVEDAHLRRSFESEVRVLAAGVDDVLRSEHARLEAFARVLERSSTGPVDEFEALAPHFVDAVPYRRGQDPIEIASWFDPGNYTIEKNKKYGNLWIQGGPRARVFFPDAPKKSPALNKIPLVRWNKRYSYVSSTHMLLPRGLNHVYDQWGGEMASGILLHAKFLDTFTDKAEEELKRRQHYRGSVEYKAYAENVAATPELWCKWSEKYINWRQLEILGLMSKGNWA